MNESTKNLLQNVDRKKDENVQLGSTLLIQKTTEIFSEFNALMAKFENEMKRHCKISTRYFVERQERIQERISNLSVDEKFSTYVDGFLQELKRFLVIRGISVKNQNSLPSP